MSNKICTASGKIMHATAAGAYKHIPRRGDQKERARLPMPALPSLAHDFEPVKKSLHFTKSACYNLHMKTTSFC